MKVYISDADARAEVEALNTQIADIAAEYSTVCEERDQYFRQAADAIYERDMAERRIEHALRALNDLPPVPVHE